jgi:HIRAN domain
MTFGPAVLILVLVAVLWFAFRSPASLRRNTATSTDPVGTLAGPGTYAIDVVGESHYQRALNSICGGRKKREATKHVQAALFLEDQNPYDNQAVRVDVDNMTVGYLPRETARIYRTRLREAGHPRLVGLCNAVIRGGWDRGPQDRGSFGIWLDLPSK